LPDGVSGTPWSLAKTEIASWNADDDTAEETWTPSITFSNKKEVITLTITVENNSLERGVTLSFAPTINDEPIPVNESGDAKTVTSGNIVAYATADDSVDKSASADSLSTGVCTIVLEIDNKNTSFKDIKLGGKLLITNAEATV